MKYKHDLVHTNIPITTLEENIINCGLFNRLQYITQTSVSYFTFPSLKHTRYSHSLGTMHIAGQMFCNIIKNTEPHIVDSFYFDFKEVIEYILSPDEVVKDQTIDDQLKSYLRGKKFTIEDIEKMCNVDSFIYNKHFDIYQNNIKNDKTFYFLILETVRIVGLLHDVGHMPFSHLLEDVLKIIHKNIKDKEEQNQDITEKEKILFDYLEDVINSKTPEEYKSLEKQNKVEYKSKPLHESMGEKISDLIFSDILEGNDSRDSRDTTDNQVLGFIIKKLVEFTFKEKEINGFKFKKIHKIVDGVIDADRLDYVQRDVIHSGLNIVSFNPEKLIMNISFTKQYNLLFNGELLTEIESFLESRYLSYNEIIFHHKVIRTGVILEETLINIMEDTLQSKDENKESHLYKLSDSLEAIEEVFKALYSDHGLQKEEIAKINQFDESWLLRILKTKHFELQHNSALATIDNLFLHSLEDVLDGKENFITVWDNKEMFLNSLFLKLNKDNKWNITEADFKELLNEYSSEETEIVQNSIKLCLEKMNKELVEDEKIFYRERRFKLGTDGINDVYLQYGKNIKKMSDVSMIEERLNERNRETLDFIFYASSKIKEVESKILDKISPIFEGIIVKNELSSLLRNEEEIKQVLIKMGYIEGNELNKFIKEETEIVVHTGILQVVEDSNLKKIMTDIIKEKSVDKKIYDILISIKG